MPSEQSLFGRSLLGRAAVPLRDLLLSIHARIQRKRSETVSAAQQFRAASVCIVGGRSVYAPGRRKSTLSALFGGSGLHSYKETDSLRHCSCTVLHSARDNKISAQIRALFYSMLKVQPLYFVETSFLAAVDEIALRHDGAPSHTARAGAAEKNASPDMARDCIHANRSPEYRVIYSYLIDDMGFYFDAQSGSRMESFLNSPEFFLSAAEKARCAAWIRIIVANRLTKYNFQSPNPPACLQRAGAKVLVVDQVADDASVRRGGGSAASFTRMLTDALRENPEATVYVKSHPEACGQQQNGYYGTFAHTPRVVILTDPVNAYALLAYMAVVYTCTSQLGFEALMAGKRVKTYGMPIYAGWGLTEDTLACPRRTRKRGLEEIFYALYVAFAVHIDPFTLERCSLERYLESLLALQAMYRRHI